MHFEQTIELGIVHQERSTGVHVQGNRRILQRRGLEWDLEPPKHLQRADLLQTATVVDCREQPPVWHTVATPTRKHGRRWDRRDTQVTQVLTGRVLGALADGRDLAEVGKADGPCGVLVVLRCLHAVCVIRAYTKGPCNTTRACAWAGGP